MDLEARIRSADPAGRLMITAVDPEMARGARRRFAARPGYMVSAGGALVAAAIAAALAIPALLSGAPVTLTSAAAAALTRAGHATPANETPKLASGQYFYSEVRTLAGAYYTFGDGSSAQRSYVVQYQLIQTWGAADGSDRQVVTYDGPQLFTTPASRKAWTVAGRPQITPPTNMPFSPARPLGQWTEYGGPGVLTPPDDLSRLPTSPAALSELIDHDETGLSEISSDPALPASGAYTFSTAARILATPALGSSAALRTALYRVMASVPGIELLGKAADHSGRRGIAIAGPLGGDGYSHPGSDRGVRDELIIDPSDGAVLELAQVIANPSLESPESKMFVGDRAGQVIAWTDYLASGVVDSPAATVPSQPTQTPAA